MVGRTVRILRQDAGMKQYELAARAKVHPQTINRIEKGRVRPDLATLQRLADALGTTVGALLDADHANAGPAVASTPAA